MLAVKEEVKYTPPPYTLDYDNEPDSFQLMKEGAVLGEIYGAEAFPCVDEADYDRVANECVATARFIVCACNSHDELLEACEAVDAFFKRLSPSALDQTNLEFLIRVRAAIAKAKTA